MRQLADKAGEYLSVAHTFTHLLDGVPDHPLPARSSEDSIPSEDVHGDLLDVRV